MFLLSLQYMPSVKIKFTTHVESIQYNSVFNVNVEEKVDIHVIKKVIPSSAMRLALKFLQQAEVAKTLVPDLWFCAARAGQTLPVTIRPIQYMLYHYPRKGSFWP